MIIEIEGPDCAGKSTFARLLMAAHDRVRHGKAAAVIKAGPPDPPGRDPFEEYETALIAADPDDYDDMVILDRWALGETIYGPLLRGSSRLSPGGILHVTMLMESLGASRMLMLPPAEILAARHAVRGDSLISADQLSRIREEYADAGDRLDYSIVTDMDHLHERAGGLVRLAGGFSRDAKALGRIAPGYVGTTAPSVVLAGDVRAGSHIPAFTPASRSGCAWFLMEALAHCSQTVVREVGILNTGEPGMQLAAADEYLCSPSWVALGAAAYGRLSEAGIRCARMPHPQWVRRFAFRTMSHYGVNLLRAGGLVT